MLQTRYHTLDAGKHNPARSRQRDSSNEHHPLAQVQEIAVELKRSLNTLDVDNLSEEEKARQLRLLSLRERVTNAASREGSAADPDSSAGAGQLEESPPDEGADQGEEVNAFLKGLVDKKRARHHQLQIIQDFFENPVDFGVEIDYIPSGTPLSEIKARMKELRYRIKLLNSVLDSFNGELAMLEQAERSALSPSAGEQEQTPGARTREDILPDLTPRADES